MSPIIVSWMFLSAPNSRDGALTPGEVVFEAGPLGGDQV